MKIAKRSQLTKNNSWVHVTSSKKLHVYWCEAFAWQFCLQVQRGLAGGRMCWLQHLSHLQPDLYLKSKKRNCVRPNLHLPVAVRWQTTGTYSWTALLMWISHSTHPLDCHLKWTVQTQAKTIEQQWRGEGLARVTCLVGAGWLFSGCQPHPQSSAACTGWKWRWSSQFARFQRCREILERWNCGYLSAGLHQFHLCA